MQNPSIWKTFLSFLLVLASCFCGIFFAAAIGDRALGTLPWTVVAVAVALACAALATNIDGKRHWREAVGGFLILAALTGIVYPVFQSARQVTTDTRCLTYLKQIGTGIGIYTYDYDGRYPQAAGWYDATARYWKGETFRCPKSEAPYSYALNQAICGKKESDLTDPPNTIAVFERDGADRNQTGGPDSVAYRHGSRSCFATAEGIPHWLVKDIDTTYRWKP